MDRDIYEAAVEGSVTALQNLLQQDALVLDRFLVGCHAETPLHIASMLGHAEFVKEILSRKPELAGALDARKSSPLHLATAKGYLDIVKMLVSVNPEACFVCDRDGRNPLHIAAIKGHVSVLKELVQIRSDAARVIVIDRGETILHLCVRYNQLQAMELLMESMHDDEFLNSKDEDGNTLLHVAVAEKQIEAIKILTTSTAIEVNDLNAYGFTALDLSTQSRRDVKDWEIWELLRRFAAVNARNARNIHSSAHEFHTTEMVRPQRDHPTRALKSENKGSVKDQNDDWLEKMRNALMFAASLIATMAFQVGVNPPGGVWQESSSGNQNDLQPHGAGNSIVADLRPYFYRRFLGVNTTGFVASLSIILLLISGVPITRKIPMWILMVIRWIAVHVMAYTYLWSIVAVSYTQDTGNAASTVLYGWFGLAGFLVLWNIISFIVKMVNGKSRRQRRQVSSSMSEHYVFMVGMYYVLVKIMFLAIYVFNNMDSIDCTIRAIVKVVKYSIKAVLMLLWIVF